MKHPIKLYIFALSLSFFACQSNSQIIKDQDVILRGPIKSVEINTYKPDFKDSAIQKGELVNTSSFTLNGGGGKLIFDKEGRCISFMNYKESSTNAMYYNEYEYSKGNLIKIHGYDTPQKTIKTTKTEYKYDHQNRVYQELSFRLSYCKNDELWLTNKYVFEYNEYNDIIKQIDTSFVHYDCDDVRIRNNVHIRNPQYKNGLRVEDDTYTYEYDQDGNIIKKIDKNNSPMYYEYYPSGVRKKEYLAEDEYDEYDEDGYLIKSTHSVRGGFLYTLKYSDRDEYGNWTRMVIYRDYKPYLIGERTITYYD